MKIIALQTPVHRSGSGENRILLHLKLSVCAKSKHGTIKRDLLVLAIRRLISKKRLSLGKEANLLLLAVIVDVFSYGTERQQI